MSTATGTIKSNMAGTTAGRRRNNAHSEALTRSRVFYFVLIIGLLGIMIVLMSAYSANLRRVNNELESENAYIQAEIDSLESKIGDATNISKIEKIATEELGMVHPSSENCIALEDTEFEDTNLAATIKDEAYD